MDNVEIVNYSSFEEFLLDIREYVFARYIGYFQFIRRADKLLKNGEPVYKTFTIKRNGNIEIIYIQDGPRQSIYGNHTNAKSVELIQGEVDFALAKEVGLMGSKLIIDAILKGTGENLSNNKHRLYYACSEPKEPLSSIEGSLCLATIKEQKELSSMGLEFYKEEFKGQGLQTDEGVVEGIVYGISEKQVYYWKHDGQIVSYLGIIEDLHSNVIIGSIYTKPAFRGKSFAKALVYHFMKQRLMSENVEFGFMVDVDNIASIKMFSSVGFNKVYETGIYS